MRRSLIPPPRGAPSGSTNRKLAGWHLGPASWAELANFSCRPSLPLPPAFLRVPCRGLPASLPRFPDLSLSQSPVLSRAQRLGEGQGPGIRFPLPRGSREVVEMNDGVFQWDNQEVAALTPKGARRGRLRGRWRGLPSWRPGPRPRWSSRCPCSPRTAGASPASRLAACARRCRS